MKFRDLAHAETYRRGQEAAEAVSCFINGSRDFEGFVDYVTRREHRTLQQRAMGMMIDCIWAWSEVKSHDLRNEATVMLARKIRAAIEEFDQKPLLPMI